MFAMNTGLGVPIHANSQPTARQARRVAVNASPGPLVQPVRGPDIDHPGPPVSEAYEVVRRMATLFLTVLPVQPEGL